MPDPETPPDLRQRAIALYDAFTHAGHSSERDRRAFMGELTLLAGSAAAAQVLLAGIGANPAAATVVNPGDTRIKAQSISWPAANGRTLNGYSARPVGPVVKRPAVMVVHENRGLTEHIRDITRRLALAGYLAVAPDFLTVSGGTPVDEDKARDAIGKLDLRATAADGVATVHWLAHIAQSTGKVGAVGFCWGGALVNQIATASGETLRAAVAYYGPTPDPTRAVGVRAAMLLHYAGLDDRVNTRAPAWIAALKAAKVDVEAYTYPGVNHAFNNDTSADRYNKAAADLSWARTLAFFKAKLGG
ncbi:MAG: dienelactone hydrolase family protein [Sphingomonadales bacterium]|nr:dienelactone hydrolase family protein [Sphingomonadales bacterium]